MQKIRYRVRNPVLIGDLLDPGNAVPEIEIDAYLFLPARTVGRVPAVVVPEGLGGLIDDREFRYGRFLSEHGYAALIIDSFGPRGAQPLSHPRRALAVTESMMLADVFGALAYLGNHPNVDPHRIHTFGFSYGGMISMLAAYENVRSVYMRDSDLAFAGHVSYYGCSVARVEAPVATGAPVLMMVAGLDKNVSMERTNQIADDLRRGGSPVDVVVFDNIYHQWDGRDETVRYVPFNLSRCRMQLGKDHKIRDERTGFALRGRISRALVIATSVWSGYEILRDEETRKKSDRMLLDFFASTASPVSSSVAMPEGVAAAASG